MAENFDRDAERWRTYNSIEPLITRLYERVMKDENDVEAFRVLLTALDFKARLLGLYAPSQYVITGPKSAIGKQREAKQG